MHRQFPNEAGLECAEIDIRKFHKQRERELKVYTSDEIASGKKVNGFYRFNRRVYFLYRDIKRIGKFVVNGINCSNCTWRNC